MPVCSHRSKAFSVSDASSSEEQPWENRPSITGNVFDAQPPLTPRGILRQPRSSSQVRPCTTALQPPSPSSRTRTPPREYAAGGKLHSLADEVSTADIPRQQHSSLALSSKKTPPTTHSAPQARPDPNVAKPLTPKLKQGTPARRPSSSADPAPCPPLFPLVHPRFHAIHSTDIDADRLARACGQLPAAPAPERPRAASCNMLSRTAIIAGREEDAGLASDLGWAAGSSADVDTDFGNARTKSRRAKSMRIPQSSSCNASTSTSSDRSASLAICDSADFDAMTWQQSPLLPASESESQPPPVYQPEDPVSVLNVLNDILLLEKLRLEDFLDVDEIVQVKEQEKEVRRKRMAKLEGDEIDEGAPDDAAKGDQPHIFGAKLLNALDRSSVMTVIGGYQHEIPTVVYACVEELYRTGIYQNGLFRALPNRTHLVELVHMFDQLEPESSPPSLHHASMADICALLSSYVNSLPEPIVDRVVHNALWFWCVNPISTRDEEKRRELKGESETQTRALALPNKMWRKRSHSEPRIATVTASAPTGSKTPEELRKEVADKERPRIDIARHVLKLLPPENLALFAYLFAFFTQIPLCPDNGLTYEDVARIFGHRILGGPSKNAARVLMVWLLNRWPQICKVALDEGDTIESALEGKQLRKPLMRKDSEKAGRRASVPVSQNTYAWTEASREVVPEQAYPHTPPSREMPPPPVPAQVRARVWGRPYSMSMSSESSCGTYASSTASEQSDVPVPPELYVSIMPEMDDVKAEHEEYTPHERLLHVVQEQEHHHHPRYQELGYIRSSLVSEDESVVRAHELYKIGQDCGPEDLESLYLSAEDGHDGFHEEQRSEWGRPSSARPDSPTLPADLPSSNRKLSSALQRISDLESELQRTRASDSGNVSEAHTPNGLPVSSRAIFRGPMNELQDEFDVSDREMKRKLNTAVHERDSARRLMNEFQKYLDGARDQGV
ncbi:uncharacterized protein FIBRA_08296 [Fibroporia radiculosa]|uniref:Rho-GAP domain-containing protein n=1 Tax=Fibroporia radiculosa TaxID=599839 RepID=J4H535_9APHY|nr:uncharacterized protein FIBRA_08296 [Fibroporia radiculosa]CCM06049.1 predicted protein [Fibroporia radiculosa]